MVIGTDHPTKRFNLGLETKVLLAALVRHVLTFTHPPSSMDGKRLYWNCKSCELMMFNFEFTVAFQSYRNACVTHTTSVFGSYLLCEPMLYPLLPSVTFPCIRPFGHPFRIFTSAYFFKIKLNIFWIL